MIDVARQIGWARATYNEAPTPETMLVLLDGLWAMFQGLAKARAIFGDDPRPRPDALVSWDADANRFYERMNAYFRQRDAMARGEITGIYSANVVGPLLYGQGYASPGGEAWSLVRSPDFGTVYTLANQLDARAEGPGVAALVYQVRAAIDDANASMVQEIKDRAAAMLAAGGSAAATGAADVLEERVHDLVEDLAPKIRGQAQSGVLMVVLGGVALLGLGWFVMRGRR